MIAGREKTVAACGDGYDISHKQPCYVLSHEGAWFFVRWRVGVAEPRVLEALL